ncbi:MAG: hypothetical protein WBE93_25700 [Pseudolabrys sp.]
MSRASLALSVLIAALSVALGKAGRAAAAADQTVVLARGEQPAGGAGSPAGCHQCDDSVADGGLHAHSGLPVALATMPLAELSARLLKLVF